MRARSTASLAAATHCWTLWYPIACHAASVRQSTGSAGMVCTRGAHAAPANTLDSEIVATATPVVSRARDLRPIVIPLGAAVVGTPGSRTAAGVSKDLQWAREGTSPRARPATTAATALLAASSRKAVG
jgi:hypothetical protein